jgi:ribose transport system ATP-binding protein
MSRCITLPRYSAGGGWLRGTIEAAAASTWVQALGVRAGMPGSAWRTWRRQPAKVVIAGGCCAIDVLLFDEPTRGIDVGARFEIYELLDNLAAKGKAIVVVSSDLPELMALCDRIAVMSAGRLAATFRRGEWSQDRIMTAALSGYLAQAA